jgi:hypothetical protein
MFTELKSVGLYSFEIIPTRKSRWADLWSYESPSFFVFFFTWEAETQRHGISNIYHRKVMHMSSTVVLKIFDEYANVLNDDLIFDLNNPTN